VIPTIITQIANKTNTIKLGATNPTRDFSFIEDTVSGFISSLKSEKGVGETINLGSNFEVSIEDTAKLIAEIMGVSVEISTDEERLRPENSEVERLWADNSKALEILGWRPSYAGLNGFREGLAKSIDWFTQPENLKLYKSGIYNL
jgi:dTDP-glucose 4,6-dehydratase